MIKDALDWTAVSAALASFLGMLPEIIGTAAALMSFIWLAIRAWESVTVQNLIRKWK